MGDHLLEDTGDISTHIYSFYKELFSAGPWSGVVFEENFLPAGAQVSDDENAELTLSLLPGEVKRAVMDMKANLAPGQMACQLFSSRNSRIGFRR